MSESEDSNEEAEIGSLKRRFGSLVHPRLDTDRVNSLKESG